MFTEKTEKLMDIAMAVALLVMGTAFALLVVMPFVLADMPLWAGIFVAACGVSGVLATITMAKIAFSSDLC